MKVPVVSSRDPVRRHRWWRAGRGVVLAGLLVAVFVAAWRARFGLPAVPLADEDVWGYLYPSIAKLTGGIFEHSISREWPYPAFLLVNLFCFNSFTAVSHVQHLLGLLSGGFLLGAWAEFTGLARPARRFAAREATAWAAGLMGVGLVAVYLLSRRTVLAEHTLRPEAVFPCFGALHLWLTLGFVRRRWGQPAARRETAWRWGAGAVFVACVLLLLRPAFGFAAVFTGVPVALAVLVRDESWRGRWRLVGAPLTLAALTLFLPERQLAARDRFSVILMPAMRLAIHADLVRAQMATDLARPEGPPRYDRAWLEALKARLDQSFEHSARPGNRWPFFGFNADYLVAVEPFHEGSFAHDAAGDQALREFCNYYYFRTCLHQPGAMLRKIVRELGHFYRFDRMDLRWKALRHTVDPYSQLDRAPLAADNYYPRTLRSLDVVTQPTLQERAGRSDAFRRYLARCQGFATGGTSAKVSQPKAVGVTENLVHATYLPLLLLAVGLAVGIVSRPAWRARLGLAGAMVPVLFAYNFGMCLTVAIVQTLGTGRYAEVQAIFTWFAWAAGCWLLGMSAVGGTGKSRAG